MQPPVAVIPARSEKQALDWSLVLVSQGIETTIDRDAEKGAWGLLVREPDYNRALSAIRQYRAENRGQLWRKTVPGTELIFDWRAVFWFLLLAFVYWLDQAAGGRLKSAGIMDNQAVHAGSWWRLFTATMLHGDAVHLAMNAATGVFLLGLVMGTFRPGIGLFGAYLTGVASNLAGLLLYTEPHRSLGASGFVLGALGMLTGESIPWLNVKLMPRQLMVRALAGGFLLLILLGVSPDPQTDVLAHVTGFLAGIVIGGMLASLPAKWLHKSFLDWLSCATVGALAVLSWWMALRR
jgi:membrane associated rhomboid family serine protease